jgi:hypothetical protein
MRKPHEAASAPFPGTHCDGLSAREQVAVREAAYQAIRFALWLARTNGVPGVVPLHESTREELLDEVAGGNLERWAVLASKALLLARDPRFQSRMLRGLGGSGYALHVNGGTVQA